MEINNISRWCFFIGPQIYENKVGGSFSAHQRKGRKEDRKWRMLYIIHTSQNI